MPRLRQHGVLVRLLRALLERDYNKLARQVLKFGRPLGEISMFDFSQDLATRLDPYFGLSLQEINLRYQRTHSNHA